MVRDGLELSEAHGSLELVDCLASASLEITSCVSVSASVRQCVSASVRQCVTLLSPYLYPSITLFKRALNKDLKYFTGK